MSGRKRVVVRASYDYAAEQARRRAAIVERHARQVVEAQRQAARLLAGGALAFATAAEVAVAERLNEQLRNIAAASDPVLAERAAGQAAEYAAGIARALSAAHTRQDTVRRIDRMLSRVEETSDQPALVARREALSHELSRLRHDILRIPLGESSANVASASKKLDELAESSAALNAGLRFISSAAQQPWASAEQIAQWREKVATAAARDHRLLLASMDEIVEQAGSRYDQASADAKQMARERKAAVTRLGMELLAQTTSLEGAIFESDYVSICADIVLPASSQLSQARGALTRGNIEEAQALIRAVSATAAQLPATAAQRRDKAAAEHEAWQSRLDELAATARARASELPDLAAHTLTRIEELRDSGPGVGANEAARLAVSLEQAAAQANRFAKLELVAQMLQERAGVGTDKIAEIMELAAAPGRTVVIQGRVAGKPIQFELTCPADGTLALQKDDDDRGEGCEAFDGLVAELSRRLGEGAIDYYEEDGTARPVPAFVIETIQREATAEQIKAREVKR
jgi:hypothetical protein